MQRINFSNINLIWASILVETFWRLGVTVAIVCPGSRSAPLAVALAQHGEMEAIPILDERSAAFFALGIARRTGKPPLLVCTSGTAGANFYPAVIEAHESSLPLIVLTADRPAELRHCNSGQTVDQQKLYGSYPNLYVESSVPAADLSRLAYLRQMVIQVWERSQFPVAGPVHVNLPFRDPLAPVPQVAAEALAADFDGEAFFAHLPWMPAAVPSANELFVPPYTLAHETGLRGVIVAGPAQPCHPQSYCDAVARLAHHFGFPVLAEGLSPLRNWCDRNPNLITAYDGILRNDALAHELAPEIVIRIGETPTSKELRLWLEQTQPRQWIVDGRDRNLDPLHLRTIHLRQSVEQLAATLPRATDPDTTYLARWRNLESQWRHQCDRTLTDTSHWFEGKVAWLLSQHLPPETPLFIANSTPVRDVEWFWKPGDRHLMPYFNRGANGIDGTLSSALGVMHHHRSGVLLTGDLALLHDTNGFLLRRQFMGHLTIVLINNAGGGIFEMLPISQFEPPFERFFATPQEVNFAQLCATYSVEYETIQDWNHFIQRLNSLPETGIRVLEVQCDRTADAQWRRTHFQQWSQFLR